LLTGKEAFKKNASVQLFINPVRSLYIYEKMGCILACGMTNQIQIIDMNNFNNISTWNFSHVVSCVDLSQNL